MDVQLACHQGPAPQPRAGEAVRALCGAMGPAAGAADSAADRLVARRHRREAGITTDYRLPTTGYRLMRLHHHLYAAVLLVAECFVRLRSLVGRHGVGHDE